jgi:hypothetical protein
MFLKMACYKKTRRFFGHCQNRPITILQKEFKRTGTLVPGEENKNLPKDCLKKTQADA